MSGHSKWHNIRIKKQKVDQVRGKLFSKFAREIISAARAGGGSPEANARLRSAIERAREAGMPNDNVARAIQRGTGELEGATFDEVLYEGYAPGGVALMVEAQTDNRNRTASEVRSVFTKHGGNLGESGSVAWNFERKGLLLIQQGTASEDDLMLAALDAGAEDVRSETDTFEVTTAPDDLYAVRKALEEAGYAVSSAEITLVPRATVRLTGHDAQRVLRLMEALEDLDDVQRVYANFDIPDEVLQTVG